MHPVNLLFNLFRSAKFAWLSNSPCPACKNDKDRCLFCSSTTTTTTTTAMTTEFITELKQKCYSPDNANDGKNKIEDNTDCPLDEYLKNNEIILQTKLCCMKHFNKEREDDCEKQGFVHQIKRLKENYDHPLVKKYFMNNLIKYKRPDDRLPSLPLNLSNLFKHQFCCLNTNQDDRTHHISVTIYTHDKTGRLRPPMCSLRCRTCNQTTSICVYESTTINKRVF